MRGYSLISVLAAMMILMGVLIPFISLQGRLFESLKRDRFLPAIQKIEADLETLSQIKRLRSRELNYDRYRIHRQVTPDKPGLWKVVYEIKRPENGKLLMRVAHLIYKGES